MNDRQRRTEADPLSCDAGHIPNAGHKVKNITLGQGWAATPSPDTPGRLALEAYA